MKQMPQRRALLPEETATLRMSSQGDAVFVRKSDLGDRLEPMRRLLPRPWPPLCSADSIAAGRRQSLLSTFPAEHPRFLGREGMIFSP